MNYLLACLASLPLSFKSSIFLSLQVKTLLKLLAAGLFSTLKTQQQVRVTVPDVKNGTNTK